MHEYLGTTGRLTTSSSKSAFMKYLQLRDSASRTRSFALEKKVRHDGKFAGCSRRDKFVQLLHYLFIQVLTECSIVEVGHGVNRPGRCNGLEISENYCGLAFDVVVFTHNDWYQLLHYRGLGPNFSTSGNERLKPLLTKIFGGQGSSPFGNVVACLLQVTRLAWRFRR